MSCGSGWGRKSEKSSHRERRGRSGEDTEKRTQEHGPIGFAQGKQ